MFCAPLPPPAEPPCCRPRLLQLACARIGAIHAVVFGGFSAEALAGRIEGCHAKVGAPPLAALSRASSWALGTGALSSSIASHPAWHPQLLLLQTAAAEPLPPAALPTQVLITCSAVMRGPKPVGLKSIADEGLRLAGERGHSVPHVLVFQNDDAGRWEDVGMEAARDVFWQDAIPAQPPQAEVEWVEAEHPLFLLFTSGSTGKPKGVVHATGG